MLKRTLTALGYLCVFLPAVVHSDTYAYSIVIAICSFIGCYEILKCVGQAKNAILSIPVYACALIFPILTHLYSDLIKDPKSYEWLITRNIDLFKLSLGIAFIMLLFVFGYAVFNTEKIAITDAALVYAAAFYVIAAFTCTVYVRDFLPHGNFLLVIIFLCAWLTDTFAYLSGRFFGKHKLIPQVSPKKTVEGAIGGMIFCIITIVVYAFVIEKFFNANGTISANYIVLIVSGLFISIVSQTGDLVMSVIKRHYGLKDFGIMFPGHGGILDRFDSVLAVAIAMAFICTYFNMFSSGI